MDISVIMERRWVLPTVVGVSALAGGFAAGYFVGRRNSKVEYRYAIDDYRSKEATVDLADATQEDGSENDILVLDGEPTDYVTGLGNDDLEVEEDLDDSDVPDPVTITKNAFSNSSDIWDYDTELAERKNAVFYVIHKDEFMENESEYEQETLTYYVGDGIMADQHDAPIYNHTGLMGDLPFGHGSSDNNVVYIRNDAIRREWEVLKHTGRFEFEILGHSIEEGYEESDLKHSKVQRFRED